MEEISHPAPAARRRRALHEKLWLGGFAVALFVVTIAIGNAFVSADNKIARDVMGYDFLAFYSAGTLVHQDRILDLYNLDALRALQHEIAKRDGFVLGERFGPWWNPPVFVWLFVPLSYLSYPSAALIWCGINLLILLGAVYLLCRLLSARDKSDAAPIGSWRSWGLVPLLILPSMPLIQALTHGQNTCISLLIVASTISATMSGRALLAGCLAGLLFYKPQLALVISAMLVIYLGRRALLGIAMTAFALLAITLLTMPQALPDFLLRMPGNLHEMQTQHVYFWERHVTFRAFWRMLLQGREIGEIEPAAQALSLLCCIMVGALLVVTMWRSRGREGAREEVFASALVAAPLLMPFYFDYDLLLIAVSAVLMAKARMERGSVPIDGWITAAWVALFLWLPINATFGRATHVNGTVILLSVLAALASARVIVVSKATNRETEGLAAFPAVFAPAKAGG